MSQRAPMGDLTAWMIAGSCAVGAMHPVAVPVVAPMIVGTVAAARRRWLVLALAAGLLAAGRSHDAWQQLDSAPPTSVDGTARIVTDPERRGPTTVAVVAIDGHRLYASAWGPAAAALASAHAGDLVEVSGRTRRWDTPDHRRAATGASHRLTVSTIGRVGPGAPWWRGANALRELLGRGADHLGVERRSLFTGLVFGDDREQSPLVASDFRAVGLTHLLAVSGQNVAYVLTLLRPILRRLRFDRRWFTVLAVLFLFATMTRFEPSVLRATAMAALAATGDLLGRATEPRRTLATAVTVLVVAQPLLVWTVAFRLSVAASAGIIVGAGWLAARLGGSPLAETFAVTVSAQLAVAPVLVTTFGPISVVSIPANLLAGPAAGLVMAWGMTAGVVAGAAEAVGAPWIARSMHLPTRGALWWLESVAARAASVPLHRVGLLWIVGAVACATALVASWPRRRRAMRIIGLVALAGLSAQLRPQEPSGVHRVGPGGSLVADGGVTVLLLAGRDEPGSTIDDLRSLDLTHVDVIVVDAGVDRADLAAVRSRFAVGALWRVLATDTTSPATTWVDVDGRRVRVVQDESGRSVEIVAGAE